MQLAYSVARAAVDFASGDGFHQESNISAAWTERLLGVKLPMNILPLPYHSHKTHYYFSFNWLTF